MSFFQNETVALSLADSNKPSARRLVSYGFAFAIFMLLVVAGRGAEVTNEIARLRQECEELILRQSKLAEGRPVAERLLALVLKQHGEEHPDTINALHWIGYVALEAGEYAKAEETWLKSLAIQERQRTPDPLWQSRTLHMLARAYQNQSNFARSEEFLKRALEVRVRHLGPDHVETASVLRTLGRFQWISGDCAASESYLLRALHIFQRGGPDAELDVAQTLSELGLLYETVGDLERAESSIQQALKTQELQHGPEHTHTANSLRWLAGVRMRRDDLAGAEELLKRSLAVWHKLDGPGSLRSAGALSDLGLLYQKLGKLREARSFQGRALVILEKNVGPTDLRPAQTMNALGRVYEAEGEYEKAHEICTRAHSQSKGGRGNSEDLARLENALGRTESARSRAAQIQRDEESQLSNLLSFTSERQRLAKQREIATGGSINLWATMGAAEPLARSILRTKGIVLDSLLEDQRLAEAGEDPQSRDLARRLTAAKRRLTQAANANLFEGPSVDPPPTGKFDLEPLSREVESLEAALARSVAALGGARRALSVRMEDVQSAMPREAALLELLRYRHYLGKGRWEDNYGVLILSSNATPTWVRLGSAEAIDRQVKLYQHHVRSREGGDSLKGLLRDLYEQLWEPVVPFLPAARQRLIISPDSELNFVSFATLLAPDNRFLGEDYLLSYVSSGRDLLTGHRKRSDVTNLHVWANPDFSACIVNGALSTQPLQTNDAVAMREFRDLTFRALPGTEKEGRLLREHASDFGFNSVVLYLGRAASEAELKRIESPPILHLATHGFILPERSLRARTGSFESEEARVDTVENPMLRCGLALAGAQRTLDGWMKGEMFAPENDGVVTADEIGGLRLRGTRLVVLSACDTGAGEARAGEGVFGLRRGFIQAGAGNLLLTLWPIHDEGTVALMVDFYKTLKEEGDPARALARTQRFWLTKLRTEKGIAEACRVAGPFILSFQGSDSK